MGSGLSSLLLALGVLEIVLGLSMEKLTRSKYANVKLKDINGLIKWDKITTILTGAFIIILSLIGLKSSNETLLNVFLIIVAAIIIISRFGRRKYIK